MLVFGEWLLCDDGVTRPTLRAKVRANDEVQHVELFLIDSCDRAVFSTNLLSRLGFPPNPAPEALALQGISGTCQFVLVRTVLELTRDDGSPAHIRGEFAAFTDPTATDLSILGRDVLNHFDVILSRRAQRDPLAFTQPRVSNRVR